MCVHTQDAATGCVCRRLVVLILLPGGCRAAFSTPPTHYPPTFRVRLQLHNVLASNFCANFVWGNYLEPCASEYGRSNDKVVNCKTFHFLAERVIILLVELCCFLSVPQIASCFIKSWCCFIFWQKWHFLADLDKKQNKCCFSHSKFHY